MIALVPTLLIYLVATNARAEDTIYHVGHSASDVAAPTASAPQATPTASTDANATPQPASAASSEPTVYHVGTGCHRPTTYHPSADVNVRDGYGAGDKQVKTADINASTAINTDSMSIPLKIPSQRYIDRAAQATAAQNAANGNANATKATPTSINGRNVDLSQSFVDEGTLTVKRNGETLLNGKPISENNLNTDGCDESK